MHLMLANNVKVLKYVQTANNKNEPLDLNGRIIVGNNRINRYEKILKILNIELS